MFMKTDDICKEILVSEEEIIAAAKRVGEQITKDYAGETITIVGLLTGCVPFLCELIKHIDLKVEVEFMRASSYHGTIKSSNEVKILKDLETSIKDKHVIVVDDIIDTGLTLKCIVEMLKLKGCKSIESCVMLNKKAQRVNDYEPKYFGIAIPNKFVVGYGLDYNELYRNLPYVGVVKDEIANGGN